MKIKNLTLNICVRSKHASDSNLCGIEKLTFLEDMKSLPKDEQYLVNYNFLNQRKIREYQGRNVPYWVRTEDRAKQTTFVIDFDKLDNITAALVDHEFQDLLLATNGKAIIACSPSGGRHVIYVFEGTAKEDTYRHIQRKTIAKFFPIGKRYVDVPSSESIHRSFYHSQHLIEWIKNDYVNVTPKQQGEKRFFWKEKLCQTTAERLRFCELIEPFHTRSYASLAETAHLYMSVWDFICRKNLNGPENQSHIETCYKLLGELNSRREDKSEGKTEEIFHRTESGKYPSALRYIQSHVSETICGNGAISAFRTNVAIRTRTISTSEPVPTASESEEPDRGDLVQPDSPESHGSLTSSDRRDVPNQTVGLQDDSRDGSILGCLQSLRSSLESRGFSIEDMVRAFQQNLFRSYNDGEDGTEKCYFYDFVQDLRNTLVGDPRSGWTRDTTIENGYIWLRSQRNHLRTYGKNGKSLREFTTAACLGIRLSAEFSGIKPAAEKIELPASKAKPGEISNFFNLLSSQLEVQIAGWTLDNQQTIRKMFRDRPEHFMSGLSHFITHLKTLNGVLQKELPIAIGLEDFQTYFQTHVKKAGLLRLLITEVLGVKTKGYIPHLRRNEYALDRSVLAEFLDFSIEVPQSEAELLPHLGNGNTWRAICRFTRPMYTLLGIAETERIWYAALGLSTANDIEKRKQDIWIFLQNIESTQNADNNERQPSDNRDSRKRRNPSRVPSRRLQSGGNTNSQRRLSAAI